MTEHVDVQISGNIAQVTFENPPLNFATVTLLRKIADALVTVDANPDVRAVLLMSQGKVFCAGADLVSPNGFGAEGTDPLREFYDQALRIFAAKKPIVAVIQGATIGAGLGLAVAADFRVASVDARFSANFVKLGFHPGFGLTYTLPRLIGEQHATEMLLTASRYKTEQVAPWGLVDRTAETKALQQVALEFADEIAENAPLSLQTTRATLRRGLLEKVTETLVHEHSVQIQLQKTADFAEGIKAVGERRRGNFSGQ